MTRIQKTFTKSKKKCMAEVKQAIQAHLYERNYHQVFT